MTLTKEDKRVLQERELAQWKLNIYDNPQYIYRGAIDKEDSVSQDNDKGKKNKKKNAKKKVVKEQKNTIDAMLKKQTDEEEKNKNDKMEMDADEEDKDADVEMNENKNQKKEAEANAASEKKKKVVKGKKKAKAKKKAKKDVPQMPEESDDEDMLCVE